MEIPQVSRFCCCINLKIATTFGGLFCSFLDKGISCLIHHGHAWSAKDESLTLLVFLYVIISIAFVTTLLMIIGSALERYKLMQPFLAFYVIDIHLTSFITFYGIWKLFGDSTDFGWMALLLGTLAIAFAIYYWIVVYSRYMEIYQEEVEDYQSLVN